MKRKESVKVAGSEIASFSFRVEDVAVVEDDGEAGGIVTMKP